MSMDGKGSVRKAYFGLSKRRGQGGWRTLAWVEKSEWLGKILKSTDQIW